MGFQDRDYYRGQTAAGPLGGSVVVKLIAINIAVFLANLFLGQSSDPRHDEWIMNALALKPDTLLHPLQYYRFLTYGFAHAPRELWHIGLNMVGLFCFGTALEQRYGWKEFLRFYLIAILLGGLAWALRMYLLDHSLVTNFGGRPFPVDGPSLLGASGGITAAVILFCLLYPRATLLMMFVIPMPAWIAGLVIVLLDMFGGREGVAHDVHLTGAAFAVAYWGLGWNFGRLPGMSGARRAIRALAKRMQPRPDLRVHDPEAYYEDLDAEADKLLEKVAREGEGSLSDRERRVLEAYSRRMRQKLS
ncbi:MAG TPA: rhomboid family intramembrane serine protease [Pirellulaceae bacterium]|nr:rhomboid family intramembrane serine protease [Pirellulaceae bacterium]